LGAASVVAAGAYAARRAGGLGWVHGLAVGLGYAAATSLLAPLVFPGGLTWLLLLERLAVGAAAGTLGGVVGVNLP
jgi:putative membrane protein (TIGR04086 family)